MERAGMMKVVMIGAGNVATHIAKSLQGKCEVAQVYSHSIAHANELAEAIGCNDATDDLNKLRQDGDIYIISVKDDAIESVIGSVKPNGALWVHTAGSKPMEMFAGRMKRYGVMYPMQSFSKAVEVDFSEVPIFVEGCDEKTAGDIKKFATLLTTKIYDADSETRRRLHIAAVFACNFANHTWTLADEVLKEANLPFSVLMPLIKSTVAKLDYISPKDSQTGPAVRKDYGVMQSHLAMLKGTKHDVYEMMSESIIKTNKSEN
ncbi:MAG: DUF2520 domain-containing protein [Muribaculaceae bacterium]|jgi:predicted short-subunit dehydrogenase-like oxidoreductase (DUF2520 family)|nr:DUF2520 domain-containing protein [Muribaculaceae bacterium]